MQAALDEDILLYGEGWNFGEVANDALFEQPTQVNMAGTGIGTFNDRMRDAVRGGARSTRIRPRRASARASGPTTTTAPQRIRSSRRCYTPRT